MNTPRHTLNIYETSCAVSAIKISSIQSSFASVCTEGRKLMLKNPHFFPFSIQFFFLCLFSNVSFLFWYILNRFFHADLFNIVSFTKKNVTEDFFCGIKIASNFFLGSLDFHGIVRSIVTFLFPWSLSTDFILVSLHFIACILMSVSNQIIFVVAFFCARLLCFVCIFNVYARECAACNVKMISFSMLCNDEKWKSMVVKNVRWLLFIFFRHNNNSQAFIL